jgi:hypothetical protein
VSVYGRQFKDTLEPYQTKAGKSLMALRVGEMSGAAMIEAAQSENVTMTWLLRLLGFLLMACGVYLVFRPLVVLGDVVPFIGGILSVGAGILAVVVALPLTLLTIAIAWVAVRPLLGIGLLVVSGVLIAGAIILSRKLRKPTATPTPQPA